MYEVERYVDVNTLGTARVLDVIVDEGIDLEKLVVASSMSIYGKGEYRCPNCEAVRHPSLRSEAQLARSEWEQACPDCETPLEPVPTPESKPRDNTSIYAITKKDQEETCRSVGRAYDVPTVARRYFNVFASRQALDNPYTGVCAIFSSRIKNDNPQLVFEDGEQTRDFVHVSDVARANRLAIESDAADVAVNIGTGRPTSITEVAETLIDLYGKASDLEPEIANVYCQGDIRHCYADPTPAAEELGFEARVESEDGMQELVEWGRTQVAEDNFERARAELEGKGLVGDR